MDKLRFLVETYMDYQKDRIRLENRLRSLPAEVAGETFFQALSRDVRALENSVAEEIKRELENEPLWTNYLSRINGVGPLMAGYLIAWLCRPRIMKVWKVKRQNPTLPPYTKILEETKQYVVAELPPVMDVASNPSKLHAYCGQKPGSRPVRGQALGYNPKLKTLMWKILRQILMTSAKKPSKYAQLYEKVKAEYAKRCPKPEKGSLKLKIHLTAKNITMRIFMTNLWITYRRMKGLPITTPYPAKLGEKHKIYTPEELLDR
jgi:hypothetical protein